MTSENGSVLAFLRVLGDDIDGEVPETLLCVNNLSSTPQGTLLQLPHLAGASLTDVFGGNGFNAVGDDGTLKLTMGSRDFFWLRVDEADSPARQR